MTSLKSISAILSAGFLLTTASFAFVQSAAPNDVSAPSASSSMKSAGQSAEGAVSHTYHAAKTAVEDTTITGRVKTALHEDKLTHGQDIHVDTYAGAVTLSGSVPSRQVADQAITVAKDTRGVRNVKNAISVTSD
jgi:hyperosmotically inducible periplasmic protein